MSKTIKIECETSEVLSLDDFQFMQGGLKTLSPENEAKLTRQIKKQGFSFPVAIWESPDGERWILDGHQRVAVLRKLQTAGWEIPPVPIVRVHAKSEEEAREKLLSAASNFGKVTVGGVLEFLELSGLDLDSLEDTTMPMPSKAEGSLTTWDASPLELTALFSFSAPIELQAKIRAVLHREFPGVAFEESIV